MTDNEHRATDLAQSSEFRGQAYLIKRIAAALDLAETRGYERGRRDFQFRPEGDNHHNAALCPYCSP